MRRRFLCSTAAVILVGFGVFAVVRADEKRNAVTDQEFVTEAATGGMAEVKLGQLAQERAGNPEVKKFGEKLAEDHTMANKELMALLRKKGMAMPTKELPQKMQDTYNRLSRLKGEEFDRVYLKDMLQDHRHDIALFESISKTGKDADIRAFAMKTLPTLREHYQKARELAGEKAER
jgi:putative membrane protein